MFNIEDADYPVRFSNYQRNASSPARGGSKVKLVWERELHDDFDGYLDPGTVLAGRDHIGVLSSRHLLVYRSSGSFRYMLQIAENSRAVFGKNAFSYFNSAQLLNYQDYDGKPLLNGVSVPGYGQWAFLLLFKPALDDYLSVAQFSGGPMQREGRRPPKRYAVYRQPYQDFFPSWHYDTEGEITHALLTNDANRLVLLQSVDGLRQQAAQVVLIHTGSGEIQSKFDLDYSNIESASLDTRDHLLVVGNAKGKDRRSRISCIDLSGRELWSHELRRPLTRQPPACGTDGRVFVVTDSAVLCLKAGKRLWTHPIKAQQDNTWLTITRDNSVVLIHDGHLALLGENGDETFNIRLGGQDERFRAPAAIDGQGRIYIASDRKFYCFE